MTLYSGFFFQLGCWEHSDQAPKWDAEVCTRLVFSMQGKAVLASRCQRPFLQVLVCTGFTLSGARFFANIYFAKNSTITKIVILQLLLISEVPTSKTTIFASRKNAQFLQFAAKCEISQTSHLLPPFSYVNINIDTYWKGLWANTCTGLLWVAISHFGESAFGEKRGE